MTRPAPAVAFENVSFRYRGGRRDAIAGIGLEVAGGETVAVAGASGSGRSTLCCCVNGLVPHFLPGDFTGRVVTCGRPTAAVPVRSFAGTVGIVFQDFEAQLFCTTAELEVAFGPENLALPRDEIRGRVRSALARTGLGGHGAREPSTLSGGEKQRLAVAAALSVLPSLLVLDEPTSDLDPRGKEEIHAIARALRDAREMSLLIVEPEAEEAVRADRVVVLREGRIDMAGRPAEVFGAVDRLAAAGVRPPPSAELLARLGLPGAATPEGAVSALRAAGFVPARLPPPRPPAAGAPAVLSAAGVSFSYPGAPPVLCGLDFSVGRGEIMAVLGPNGSGKTTLARLLAGLLAPSDGLVLSGGDDLRRLPRREASRRVGFVFQNPDHQIFAETVAAEVAFGPRLHGLPEPEVSARVEEALAAVRLSERRESDPFLLSKGERQRVAVASVLATRPETLILDEPTTGLDYGEVREMMSLLRRLRDAGHTIVMVTHSMWVAAEYAGRVVVMAEGRILADGPPEEVFHRPDLLARAALKPPEAARIARLLGLPAVSVDGIASCLARRA